MTINSATRKAGPFLGDGVATVFPFTFKVFSKNDVQVTRTDGNGAETNLVLDSDYSVTVNVDQTVSPGGSITYPISGSPLAIGYKLTLTGGLQNLQGTSLPDNGPWYPSVIEKSLDYATVLIQQLQEKVDRSIKIGVSDTPLTPLPGPQARANELTGFDAAGNMVLYPLTASVGAGDLTPYSLVAGVDFAPGATSLALPKTPGSPGNIKVYFDALPQDFTQWSVSGQTLTVAGGVPNGVTRVWGYIGSTLSTQIPPDGSITNAKVASGAAIDADKIAFNSQISRVIVSISDLRALDKTKYSRAFVIGYYASGDGGGGDYWLDSTDTTSTDNGGTIIVASDGGRWKLIHNGVVSVRQFGAKGDGTTDDAAAIQAAINVFGTSGGKIWLPPGGYGIGSSGITLPNEINGFNGLVLEGAGQGVSLRKLSGTGALLNVSGARCTVRGITFNANNVATTCIYCNTLFDGQPTLIENCALLSCAAGGQGIYNNDGDSYMIRNCYFLGCGNWAVESRNNMMNSTFSANYVQGSGAVHLNSATQQAEGFRITDNTILASGGSGYAVDVEFGLEIIIANNICDQLLTGGVRIRNNASYVRVLGNWFGGGTLGHVIIGDNANRCFVIGNTFEGGAGSQVVANSAVLGNINSLTIQDNIHGNINAAANGILLLQVKRASVCGNIMPGAVGSDSIYCGSVSTVIVANNALWKTPANDGSATLANNVIG